MYKYDFVYLQEFIELVPVWWFSCPGRNNYAGIFTQNVFIIHIAAWASGFSHSKLSSNCLLYSLLLDHSKFYFSESSYDSADELGKSYPDPDYDTNKSFLDYTVSDEEDYDEFLSEHVNECNLRYWLYLKLVLWFPIKKLKIVWSWELIERLPK